MRKFLVLAALGVALAALAVTPGRAGGLVYYGALSLARTGPAYRQPALWVGGPFYAVADAQPAVYYLTPRVTYYTLPLTAAYQPAVPLQSATLAPRTAAPDLDDLSARIDALTRALNDRAAFESRLRRLEQSAEPPRGAGGLKPASP